MADENIDDQQVPVLLPDFQDLQLEEVINDNFDKYSAFERAMRVFFLSYPKKHFIHPQIYLKQRNDYYYSMLEIFRPNDAFKAQDIQQMDDEFSQLLLNTVYFINVGAKRFYGKDGLRNASLLIKTGTSNETKVALDVRNELQNNAFGYFQMTYDMYLENIESDVTIKFNANDWPADRPDEELKEFRIQLKNISIQGFEDWFDFGRGVRLLIKISFTANDDPTLTPKQISDFHLHSILYILDERLQCLHSKKTTFIGHDMSAQKYRVSTLRPKSDPTSELAFWSNQLGGRGVKYCDLQIGNDFQDDFPDTVCLCSEWCNWNAFFHYNPIYRCLMVGHNQFFMQRKCHIPDMYQLVSLAMTSYSLKNQEYLGYIEEIPFIRLISSANEYRKAFHKKYSHLLATVEPLPQVMTGLSYKSLTQSLPIFLHLSAHSDPNPFSHICVDNIITYVIILSDLHERLGQYDTYVNPNPPQLRLWRNAIDQLHSDAFNEYLHLSYQRLYANKDNNYDQLFSEDYEYSSLYPRLDAEKLFNEYRERVRERPINITVLSGELISILDDIFRFAKTVQPKLQLDRHDIVGQKRKESLVFLSKFWKGFDYMFQNTSFRIDPNFYYLCYNISAATLEDFSDLDPVLFHVFYTLKLYSIGFALQSSCMETVFQSAKDENETDTQVFNDFRFVFNIEEFEQQFRINNGINLFVVNNTMSDAIVYFYLTFWGRAAHEEKVDPFYDEFVAPVYRVYKELYSWWQCGGQTVQRFTSVFTSLTDNFRENRMNSNHIFETRMLSTFHWLFQNTTDYIYPIPDQLVYYLVKANCFVLMSTIATFLREIYSNTIGGEAMTNNQAFVLSKPGWCQLFDTILDAFHVYIDLKTQFIVFDDEFERIDNALEQTYRHIKGIYQEFYKKIVWSSLRNMSQLCDNKLENEPSEEMAGYFLPIHISVLLGLIACNTNVFRFWSVKCKKTFFEIQRTFRPEGTDITDPNRPKGFRVREALYFCDKACEAYLKDPEAIRTAQPLLSTHWLNYFRELFQGKPILKEIEQEIRNMRVKLNP